MPEKEKIKKKPAKGSKSKKKRKKKKQGWFAKTIGFIAGAGSLFYSWSTKDHEKQIKTKPRIFGRRLTYAGFIALTLTFIVLIYTLLTTNSVGVEHESIIVTGLSDDFEGYNILFITDLNSKMFGEDQSTLMRQISNEKYNLVIFGGDMVGPSGDPSAFYALIDQIGTKKPVYFIAGDSDPSPVREKPRTNTSGLLTVNEMVLADWVLGAIDRGANYLDTPVSIKKGASKLWLFPDTFLNLNVNQELESYKDEVRQQEDSYLEGIERTIDTLPLATYRRNVLRKASDLISSVHPDDLILMVSHEAPTDSQLRHAQAALNEEDAKNFFIGPDLVLCGHYCAGEWRLPVIGALHVNSSILPRYGWFPDQSYVRGQRTVGNVIVYTSSGLSSNSNTLMRRTFNPPRASLVTLTGELPASFLD